METKIVAADPNGNPMIATVHRRDGVEVGGVVFQSERIGKYCDQGLRYWFGWYAGNERGEADTFQKAIEAVEETER
tara:strand:+ start:1159 stop:1386 length:228 start_codon:yes stop_codon:yes gene_type:complete